MAKHGMVCCDLSPMRATFRPIGSVCNKHEPAPEDVAKARMEWAVTKKIAGSA